VSSFFGWRTPIHLFDFPERSEHTHIWTHRRGRLTLSANALVLLPSPSPPIAYRLREKTSMDWPTSETVIYSENVGKR
jgi:hypothetical protein